MGIRHVMEVFTRHHAPGTDAQPRLAGRVVVSQQRIERALDVICDEDALDGVPS